MAAKYADASVRLILSAMNAGKTTAVVDALAIAQHAGLKTTQSENRYVPLAPVLALAIGADQGSSVAIGIDELKYVPFAANGQGIILIVSEAESLTPDRARRVASAATARGIVIHTVWLGTSRPKDEKLATAWIAAATGGTVTDLSSSQSLCYSNI